MHKMMWPTKILIGREVPREATQFAHIKIKIPEHLAQEHYLTHAFRKEKNRATAATAHWALIGKLFPLIGKKIAQETAQSCSAALLKQAATAGWIPSF